MANYRLRQTGQEVQDLLDKIEQSKIENGTVTIGDESLTPVSSEELQQGLAGKQDVISDLSAIREGAALGATAYQKPSDGIAKEDLVASVQASLEKADTAIQSETDPTVPAWAKQPAKPSYALAELQEDATHRTVTDAEKADWNGKQDAIDDLDDIRSGAGSGTTAVQPSQMQAALAGKQDTLVSRQNIKTVNGESLLGSGDLVIETGDEAVWGNISGTLADQTDLANALGAKYEKPSTGIPEADLAEAVREKLDKADTALQSESDPVFAASPAHGITANDIASWNAKYTKPASGIPETDLASGVTEKLNAEEVFIATYGTTTQAQVQAAASAGKVIVCFYGSRVYVYAGESAAGYSQFTSVLYDKAYRVYLRNSSWGSASYDLPIDAVLYTTQNLSDSQKSVARGNIGAGTYSKPANGIPASDLASGVIPDVSQFITKSVNDLVNYYTKSQTYTQTEVNNLIGAIQQFHYEIVATLPATGAGNILYLLGPTGTGADKYEEYVYANSTWTKIGDTSIDLSDYITTAALNTALADYTTTANLTTLLAGKQDTISDLATIRSGAAAGATAYQKPSGGIPKDDLASAVQTSLGKADTALQSFTETDPTVPAWAKTANPPTEVFIAEYNVTTFADIYAAYQAGKSIFVKQGGTSAVLTDIGSSSASFAQPMGAGKMWECFSVSQTGGWSRSWEEIVDVTNLSQLSDDATHRLVTDTEKATWNAKYDKPSTGIPASDLASGVIPSTYAGSPSAGGPANKTLGIPYGSVDSDSTATNIKATVDNFPTTLVAGVCAYIRNDVVASASGWTLNINGTGAKPVYASNADATRTTTVFSAASTYLFVYNPTRVSGGCWDIFYGYNSDTNTIGYNLRTGAATPPTASKFYRYRILFTSQNGQSLIPANTSSSTNATAARAVNQAKIDPFGPIFYYSTTAAVDANASVGASYAWLQYSGIALGYSFNRTGAALTMTAKDPVYIKCAPQTDGSAIMDADTPIVQALPSTEDGNLYIYLGIAESATAITLYYWHPIYWYKDGAIRQWTNASETSSDEALTSSEIQDIWDDVMN